MKDLRPLSERSKKAYHRLLERAFGASEARAFGLFREDVTRWPDGCRSLLRAAVKRACEEGDVDPKDTLSRIPRAWVKAKVVRVPSEAELLEYTRQANLLRPSERALALIPLAVGLRCEELLGLTREQVRRAAKFGELIVTRKGGDEQILTVSRSMGLFADLLEAKAAAPNLKQARQRSWFVVGEILCRGEYISQYHRLRNLVVETGKKAGIPKLRPHLLRHAFATRLNEDDAPLPVIQYALGHKHVTTTSRYIHVAATKMQKYMRDFAL